MNDSMSGRSPCSAPASWARRSPPTSSTCSVPVILFDLPAKEGPKNGIVTQGGRKPEEAQARAAGHCRGRRADRAGQLRGAPRQLQDCDLIIEAIAERMDWKLDLYTKVAPAIAPHAIVASQHLGPVDHQAVAKCCPKRSSRASAASTSSTRRATWRLVELIATPTTQPEILDQLEAFVTTRARQVRRARQGHAELHRQPRRHRRHAGDDEGSRELRPDATTSSTT